MPGSTMQTPPHYDARWFIWTIVFLVVVGISLVSYIVLSDNGTNEVDPIVVTPIHAHAAANKTPIKN